MWGFGVLITWLFLLDASLREKLNKIMASEYFTTTPEIKAPVDVAAAAGNYTSFQVPIQGSLIPPVSSTISVEHSEKEYQPEVKLESYTPYVFYWILR